jgi:hypothetical protein
MAGKSTLSAVAAPRPNQRTRRRRARNRRTVSEIRALCEHYEVQAAQIGDVADVLDECLRRAVGDMRFAAGYVDDLPIDDFWVKKVDAHGNILVEPHPWVQLEKLSREEVVEIATRMAGLDIDERRVALQEAQAALLQRALRVAMEAVGLTPEQQKLLGPALRNARAVLEGAAVEGTADLLSEEPTTPAADRAGMPA